MEIEGFDCYLFNKSNIILCLQQRGAKKGTRVIYAQELDTVSVSVSLQSRIKNTSYYYINKG